MTEWIDDLVGDDWEGYCGALLRRRYRPVDVQAVPAVQGDLGIDYWIRGFGDVYQCYGTEFGDSVSERLRLQKRKLSDEVRKLKRNAESIARMIAPTKTSRYVFLVPQHDSRELLELAAKKTLEVQRLQLPFCAPDFEIVVQSLADFTVEQEALQRAGLTSPRLLQTDPDGQTVHDWLTDHGELATTIREKAVAIFASRTPEEIDAFVNTIVGNYIVGEDALRELERRFPEIYEGTLRVISTRRRRLEAMGGRSGEVSGDALPKELDQLTHDLSAPNVGFDKSDAMRISVGTVAKWLADCTMDPR